MKPVLVFKTSVASLLDLCRIQPLLDALIQADERWNFDLDDCDRILRIEGDTPAIAVIQTLARAGFHCEELPD